MVIRVCPPFPLVTVWLGRCCWPLPQSTECSVAVFPGVETRLSHLTETAAERTVVCGASSDGVRHHAQVTAPREQIGAVRQRSPEHGYCRRRHCPRRPYVFMHSYAAALRYQGVASPDSKSKKRIVWT